VSLKTLASQTESEKRKISIYHADYDYNTSMARTPKPTFITELPVIVGLAQDATMLGRLESGRRLCNAVLSDGLKALDLMRQSKAWQAAKSMPKGKERNTAFKACNERFGFTEYALHTVATGHKNAAGFSDRLGAHETQKIASRVFSSLQEYAFGKRGRPRFKGKNRPLHSLEGKSNVAGIRWHAETATVSWGKGFVMPVKIPTKAQDPYIHACLKSNTKYCRMVWRMEHGKRRWFVQLIKAGIAPAKYEFLSSGQIVGLDIGPSTIAVVADDAVGLERFAPSVDQPWKQMRELERAQDRSRRAMNPDNFNANGTTKQGAKRWAKSSRYVDRQSKLLELERCLAAARKRDHGELANKILGLGNLIQTEKLSYKGLQKNFGRSAKVRAPGMFVSLLKRKAESAGGKVVELNTRKLKMSQYDHVSGQCVKKSLSLRWHDLGNTSLMVQRDCYSAFLAKNVFEDQHNPSQLEQSWAAAKPLLRRAGLCIEQSESGVRLRVPTVAIPSDRIARQRMLVQGHVQNVVALGSESGNPLQSVFRTPWLSHGAV
jgi:putative transposase